MWSSFLDTFWDPCSGKFPKIILSKPHYFPSHTHFKLCNSWTILATVCYRPAPQPRQTCQLPSSCLGGVCLVIHLAQRWMATTLAQRCLTVIIEVKTKYQTWEHLQLPFLLFRLMSWVHPGKQLMRMREEDLLPRCLPSHQFQPMRAGCAVCHRDGVSVVVSSTTAGAKCIEDKKPVVLPQVIRREHSRVRRQGTGKCYDNKETMRKVEKFLQCGIRLMTYTMAAVKTAVYRCYNICRTHFFKP